MENANFLVSSSSPSSVNILMTCERKHFLTYSQGWEKIGLSLSAHFGICLHNALDIVWEEKDKNKVLQKSFQAFMEAWILPVENKIVEEIPDDYKRNPHTAQRMLSHYIDRRWGYIQECEVLGIEKEFTIPIDIDGNIVNFICIIDKIFRRGNFVASYNHKTTASYRANPSPGFSFAYIKGLETDFQMLAESYVMQRTYGEEFEGHYADLCLVHTTNHNIFQILPITLFHDSLDIWLEEFKERMRRLHLSRKMLEDGENLSRAFPRNLASCVKFNTICSFHGICSQGGEELALSSELPGGFQERKRRGEENEKGSYVSVK